MKTKKWLTPALIALTPVALTPALLTTVSCDEVKKEKVGSQAELEKALADESVKVIELTNNIEINFNVNYPGTSALNINRSVKINGKHHTIEWTYTNTDKPFARLINIDRGDKKRINVKFENINLSLYSNSNNTSVVYMDNIEGCEVSFENCVINNGVSVGNSPFKKYYGICISENNIKPSEIDIDDTTISGYGSIYNMGSNVDLEADESTFVGRNDSTGGEGNSFAAIIVSDFTLSKKATVQHIFGANNVFELDDCTITTYATDGNTQERYIENRSPSNNKVILDGSTKNSLSAYVGSTPVTSDARYIRCATDDVILTEANIWAYEGADMPAEVHGTAETGARSRWEEYYVTNNKTSKAEGIDKGIYDRGTIKDDHTWQFQS